MVTTRRVEGRACVCFSIQPDGRIPWIGVLERMDAMGDIYVGLLLLFDLEENELEFVAFGALALVPLPSPVAEFEFGPDVEFAFVFALTTWE